MNDGWITVTPRKPASKRTVPSVTPVTPSRCQKPNKKPKKERQTQQNEDEWWSPIMNNTTTGHILPHYLGTITPEDAPDALAVIKYRRELATALAQCGTEYPQGVGYSFLVEDLAGYRKRTGNPTDTKPTKPAKPTLPGIDDGSAVWKRYDYILQAWKEWDKLQGETITAILTKFPTMLADYKDRNYQTLPPSITPETALDIIQGRVLTKKKAREEYATVIQRLTTLDYKPVSIGPAQYFQDLIELQYQANQLGQAPLTDDMVQTFALLAFRRSGHERTSLSKIEEEWEIKAMTIADNNTLFKEFRTFWIKRLAAIYTDERGTDDRRQAHLTERMTTLEHSIRSDVSQLYDNQEELASAFQAVSRANSTDTPSVLSTTVSGEHDALLSQLKEGLSALANLTRELRHTGLQASTPKQNDTGAKQKTFTQWKYWCYTCGVNLHHNTADCRKRTKAAGHDEHHAATMTDPQGGNTRRNHLWHKWCHPVTNMPIPLPRTHRVPKSSRPRTATYVNPTQGTKRVRFRDPLIQPTPVPPRPSHNPAPTCSNTSPKYGALDSGATDNFMPATYVGTNPTQHHTPVKVGCANGTTMESTAMDSLNLPSLPPTARACYKFREVHMPLVSVPKLCDSGCQVTFNNRSVTVLGPNGHDVVLRGKRDPHSLLYMVPLQPTPNEVDTTINYPPSHPDNGLPSPRVPSHQATAGSAYEVQAVPNLINYLHATAGFPTKATWIQAVQQGFFTTWPGLTAERIRKYLGKSVHTVKGHMHMIKQGIRTTQPRSTPKSPSRKIDVEPLVLSLPELTEHRNELSWDLPGQFPCPSARGNKYLFIMYNHDANYIHAMPIKSRKTEHLIQAFQEGADMFRRRGLQARLVKMDNEVSGTMARYIEWNNMDYQIVSPGDHRQNHAERAIQTFKNHFISILSGTDPEFPANAWDLLLTHAIVTLNLLRRSRVQPQLSAYAQVHGQFDFNATPMGPAGCKVIVHERAQQRGSWDDHGVEGFYVGPALKHYRNYVCLIQGTDQRRVSNTVAFFPQCCKLPTTSSTDRLTMAIQDLRDTLRAPHPPRPSLVQGTPFNQAVHDLQTILNLTSTNEPKPPPAPRVISARQTHKIGTIVRTQDDQGGYKEGEVIDYHPTDETYVIHYTDNTQEALTDAEVQESRKPTQRYSKLRTKPKTAFSTAPTRTNHITYIPTPKTTTSNTNNAVPPHFAGSGSIWDEELKKMAAYRDLVKHPNPHVRDLWLRSGEDEFGRLFQGFTPNKIEGMDVLEWIRRDQVPDNKRVTYPRYTVAIRLEKADPYRTRITAGGDQLEYDGNVTTHTATMETIKTHWNSVASTPDAKYCTGDISNMYLCSALDESEYVRFRFDLIPPRIVQAYNLEPLVHNNYVYARIKMAWYGLKQSGKIAHDDLVAHLAAHGYHKAKHTQGLFLHETRDISFTLVVDDFGIKYIHKEDVEHLITVMRLKYTFKVDWEGKQYIGIHLNWDYKARQVTISMDGYVEQALKEFEHIATRPCASPSKMDRPDYGQKVQYVKEDSSPMLTTAQTKFIQQVTGKFLFYARAIDNTMLHAINEISRSKTTEATLAATKHFLNYAASNPNGRVVYRASDMILVADSDAAYLVCPEARSRAGGYHYLTNNDRTLFNGPVLVLARVIKNVMASAAEAEVAALYLNAQEALPIRQCLIELGHPQPATPLKTDNSTAKGILTGTIKQKRSKAIDMRFYWLKDRTEQGQFDIYWEPGKNNLADYPTKHHSPTHHKLVRPIYLYEEGASPETVQGCIEILRSTAPELRARKYQYPLNGKCPG